jgi:hypothetical protein
VQELAWRKVSTAGTGMAEDQRCMNWPVRKISTAGTGLAEDQRCRNWHGGRSALQELAWQKVA